MDFDILAFSKQLITKCLSVNVEQIYEDAMSSTYNFDSYDISSLISYSLSQCLVQYFDKCQTATISKMITPFHTYYCVLCLSKEHNNHLMIGPFLEKPMNEEVTYPIMANLKLGLEYYEKLKLYYASIPFIDASTILDLLYTIYSYATKSEQLPTLFTLDLSVFSPKDTSYDLHLEDMRRTDTYKVLEERYEAENKMLSYITAGNFTMAKFHLEHSPLNIQGLNRFNDTVRNNKNLLIVVNALFRKASQSGGVHPIYLDELSGKWAIKIERAHSLETLNKIPLQMLRDYCLLTKEHAHSNYSPIIKKALNFIQFNLNSNLTVKRIAEEVGLSPDYLTRLFKKELNMTVIHFINKKRIYRSLKLLNTTKLSIEEIGDLVGLSNTSYFYTLFKKETGLSPKQYRNNMKSKG